MRPKALALWGCVFVALPLAAAAKHPGAHRAPRAEPGIAANKAAAPGEADAALGAAKLPAAAESEVAGTGKSGAAEDVPSVLPGRDPNSDEPPPSSWDLMGRADDKPSFAPQNRSLTEQMFRTLAALIGVVLLLYAGAKFLMPKLVRNAQNKASSLVVLERLNLDGRNTLVVVGTKEGGRFVLGCGEAHVTLIERTPATGAFVPDEHGILRPQPGASEFGDHLAPPNVSPSNKGVRP